MPSVSKRGRAKFTLVQFSKDHIYHVTNNKNLKKTKQNTFVAKWVDRRFYAAKLLASSTNLELLKSLLKNLENDFPIVTLAKIKDLSAYQGNSNEGVPLKIDDSNVCNDTFNVPEVFSHEAYVECQWCHELCLHIKDHFCSHVEYGNRSEGEVFEVCERCGILVKNIEDHMEMEHKEGEVFEVRERCGILVKNVEDHMEMEHKDQCNESDGESSRGTVDSNISLSCVSETLSVSSVNNFTDEIRRYLPSEKKTHWNYAEIETVKTVFNEYILEKTVPKMSECCRLRIENPMLHNRSPQAIRAFIVTKLKRNTSSGIDFITPITSKIRRNRWSMLEENLLQTKFKVHYDSGTLPSAKACKQLIEENSVLKGRTPEVIKAKVSNDLRKHNRILY